jgi:hypothetical protein
VEKTSKVLWNANSCHTACGQVTTNTVIVLLALLDDSNGESNINSEQTGGIVQIRARSLLPYVFHIMESTVP